MYVVYRTCNLKSHRSQRMKKPSSGKPAGFKISIKPMSSAEVAKAKAITKAGPKGKPMAAAKGWK